MFIANPIYDSVFKYLLEDLPLAKRFLSIIIGEEIELLEVKPQEQTATSKKHLLTVYRLDFKAVIRSKKEVKKVNKQGETETIIEYDHKKVLIELQKGKQLIDVMRFRRYIGDNYSKPDTDTQTGEKIALPILTIYFLGFELSVKESIIRIKRAYQTHEGKILGVKDEFIERLTHDSVIIQIPLLPEDSIDKAEKILTVFNQKWIYDEDRKWILRYPQEDIEKIVDEDLRMLVKRLFNATQSEEIQKDIETEETFDDSIDDYLRAKDVIIWNREKIIEKLDEKIVEKDQALVEKDQALVEKDQALVEKDQALVEKDQALVEKDQALQKQNQLIIELQKKLKDLENT